MGGLGSSAKRPQTAKPVAGDGDRHAAIKTEIDGLLQKAKSDNSFYRDQAFKSLYLRKQANRSFDFDDYIARQVEPEFVVVIKEGLKRQEKRQRYQQPGSQSTTAPQPKFGFGGVPRPAASSEIKSPTLHEERGSVNSGVDKVQEYQERREKLKKYSKVSKVQHGEQGTMKSSPSANKYGANSISAMNSSLTQKWSQINKSKRFGGGADSMNHTIGGGSVASTGLQRPSTGLNASIGASDRQNRPS